MTLGKSVWSLAKRIYRRLFGNAVILLYHRVANPTTDPQLLAVHPERFREHVEIIRRVGCPMRLQSLVESIDQGRPPRRAVAVTFDDGYMDNFEAAAPLLERHDVPSTVFVAAGRLGSQGFFWDELERVILRPGRLPEQVNWTVSGRRCNVDLGEWSSYGREEFERHPNWSIADGRDPTPRHRLYRELFCALRPLPDLLRQQTLSELKIGWIPENDAFEVSDVMSPEEVQRLSRSGLWEIGAHTLTHPVLAALPAWVQREDIARGKAILEGITGSRITGFAYPFGSHDDYGLETIRGVRRAGFRYACANFGGATSRFSDRFQLPRFLVRDWSGDEFSKRLEVWLGD